MGMGDRIIACGTKHALFAMLLRFLVGPAVFAAASYLVGLRGVSLNVSTVQVTLISTSLHHLHGFRFSSMLCSRSSELLSSVPLKLHLFF